MTKQAGRKVLSWEARMFALLIALQFWGGLQMFLYGGAWYQLDLFTVVATIGSFPLIDRLRQELLTPGNPRFEPDPPEPLPMARVVKGMVGR